jgi:hypothetical protein
MSDYLSTLAARSLGLVPVAKPKLASLFEPAPAAEGAMVGPSVVEPEAPADQTEPRNPATPVSIDSAPAHGAPPPSTSGRLPLPIRPMPLRPDGADDRPPSLRIRPAQPQDLPASRLVVAALPTLAEGDRAATSSGAKTSPRFDDRPGLTPNADRGSGVTQAPVKLDRASHRDEDRWRLTEGRLSSLEQPRAQDRPTTAPRPVQDERTRISTPDSREPSSIKPANRVAAESEATGPPPPTIQVTIGRVEVRAVMPSPPAQRSRPALPVPALPLDEYLKQRRGTGP